METIPASHWLSLGHSQAYADAMCYLQSSLVMEITQMEFHSAMRMQRDQLLSTLALLGHPDPGFEELSIDDPDISVGLATDDLRAIDEDLLLQDDALLPLWERFAEALRSLVPYKNSFKLSLLIANVELANHVLEMILASLEDLSVDVLLMRNNGLGRDEIQSLTRFLERNTNLSSFGMAQNENAKSLRSPLCMLQVSIPSHLTRLTITENEIGRRCSVIHAVAPSLLTMMQVNLDYNGLGSHGAALISKLLVTNPNTKSLSLEGNHFDDDDAILLANALRINTSLQHLDLCCNRFTYVGLKELFKSAFDEESLNKVYYSNATCYIMLFEETEKVPDESGVDLSALSLNTVCINTDAYAESGVLLRAVNAANGPIDVSELTTDGRRKIKVLHALQGQTQFNTSHLSNASLNIIPMLLAFTQRSGTLYSGIGKVRGGPFASPRDLSLTQFGNLDRLFQMVRSRPDMVAFGSSKKLY